MRNWLSNLTDALRQDFRDALRGLRRSPGFTAAVVVTLALGIGANVAMFNLVDRLMFRPLAYLRDPGTVHRIYWQWDDHASARTTTSTSYARYLDLQKWTTSFSDVAAFYETQLAVGEGEFSRERRISAVSASYFDFFDARPVLGRFFTTSEDAIPRGADVAVLSHAFWLAEFGERDVRGEVLRVGNVRAAIIGVAPEGFDGVNDANPPAVYIPITTFAASTGTNDSKTYFNRYQWGWVNVMVRRKPGVTVQQASADATHAFRISWEAARADEPLSPPLASAQPHVAISSLRPGAGPNPALEARTALWLMIVASIVLVIATANVANLFLARALQRTRETAVRRALGVSRWRLIQLPLTESLTLAAMGGAAAVLIAQWGTTVLGTILMTSTSQSSTAIAEWRTTVFTLVTTLMVGTVIGLIPSRVSARGDLARALRGGVRGGTIEGQRLRGSLLILQAALSVVLLIGAALFVRSLQAVIAMPMGYDAERVLLVNRIIRGPMLDDAAQRALRAVLLSTAQSLPGVESATWVSSVPFANTSSTTLYVNGMTSDALGVFSFQATTSDYFRTMGTRILRGRGLTPEDGWGAPPVAVVSDSMARVLWPGQEALGKCFRMRSETAACHSVVGIAEDMVQRDITDARRYHYYLSIDQYTRTWGNGLLLKLQGDPVREAENIRAALQRVVPGDSYVTAQPLRGIVETARRSWRLGATVFVAFGVLTLVVAAVGLYGVVRYNVTERRHELGVRVALGAQRGDVLRLVIGHGLAFALAGTLVGVPIAWLAKRWIQPLLFEQSATDPRVYAAVCVTMMLVALAASAFPAMQAAKADANAALRAE